jgi:hypothetical protein
MSDDLPEFESETITDHLNQMKHPIDTSPGDYEPSPCFCLDCIEKRLEKTYWDIWNSTDL